MTQRDSATCPAFYLPRDCQGLVSLKVILQNGCATYPSHLSCTGMDIDSSRGFSTMRHGRSSCIPERALTTKFAAELASDRDLQPLAFIVLVVTIIAGLLETAHRYDTRNERTDSNCPLLPQVPRP